MQLNIKSNQIPSLRRRVALPLANIFRLRVIAAYRFLVT